MYAIYLPDEGESLPPPSVTIRGLAPAPGARLRMPGADTVLAWRRQGTDVVVEIPEAVRKQMAGGYAWAVELPGAVAGSQSPTARTE